ncbi:MAG: DUF4267 domain-containing protein [Candidatus Eremiobacteraeota bacterium]|nr:DUF4267 domain-containing protein [Candidatus Eremiobacteraeota bacterium]
MHQLGGVLSFLAGAGFLIIGLAAIVRPEILSHLYGLYVHELNGRGFVRATGVRDVAFGALLCIFSVVLPQALFVVLLVGAFIALADFLTVALTNRRFELPFLGGHIFGLVGLVVIATIVGMSNLSR